MIIHFSWNLAASTSKSFGRAISGEYTPNVQILGVQQ